MRKLQILLLTIILLSISSIGCCQLSMILVNKDTLNKFINTVQYILQRDSINTLLNKLYKLQAKVLLNNNMLLSTQVNKDLLYIQLLNKQLNLKLNVPFYKQPLVMLIFGYVCGIGTSYLIYSTVRK